MSQKSPTAAYRRALRRALEHARCPACNKAGLLRLLTPEMVLCDNCGADAPLPDGVIEDAKRRVEQRPDGIAIDS